MTPFQKHKLDWQNCTRCPLHEKRQNVCLVRGKLPCDVLFIGEAPGASEDVLGSPFVGPAGKLQDSAIEQTLGQEFSYALTNLIGCIPLMESEGETAKVAEPPDFAIDACAPRVKEMVWLAKPRLIVRVGKISQREISGQAQFSKLRDYTLPWIPVGKFLEFADIIHPAAILRMDVSQRGLAFRRTVIALGDALERIR